MRGDESGFTLAELLISTVILAIIFGVITEAMIVGLRTTDSTDQRVRESVDAQLFASRFARDAQGAKTVSVGDTSCGPSPAVTPTSLYVVSFGWTDAASGAPKKASYVLDPTTATSTGERVLTRWICQGVGNSVVTRNQLARFVRSVPSITCTPDGGSPAPCAGNPVSPVPRTVTLTVVESSAAAYSYTLTGTRRACPSSMSGCPSS